MSTSDNTEESTIPDPVLKMTLPLVAKAISEIATLLIATANQLLELVDESEEAERAAFESEKTDKP